MEKFDLKKENLKITFVDFINFLEGTKIICKAQHWNSVNLNVKDKRGAHIYLDELLTIISNTQDSIAESSQGIFGTYLNSENVKGKDLNYLKEPNDLINTLESNTYSFYKILIEENEFMGIKSEIEVFILNIQKYKFLFNLIK